MHIQLQICGLVIVIFLLILYKTHNTLQLVSEKVFVRMLILVIVCISLDALSVFGIIYGHLIPEWLTKTICKAYLISMIWVGYIDLNYVTIDLIKRFETYRKASIWLAVGTAVESIVVAILPIGIVNNGDRVYSEGPAVIFTYIFTIMFIAAIFGVALFVFRNKSSRMGMAVMMTTVLWIIAAGIQFLRNELLLVGFSMAVGVMIIYMVMENPDSYLERYIGCFNPYALNSFLTMKMEQGTPFCVMEISIMDTKGLEDKGISIRNAAKKFADRLMRDKKVKIFKNLNMSFLLVAENEEDFSSASEVLKSMLMEVGDTGNSVMTFTVRNAQQFETVDELLKFLTYVRNNSGNRLSLTVYVSDEMIANYNNIRIVEKEIDAALAEDRVEAFLQPIFSSEENKVTSAEALVRIRKPEGGYISPGQFIPVAEATGQVNELGERVLEKVCEFLRDSEACSLGITNIHVNLSAVQCDDINTVGKLGRIVEQYGVLPSLVNFEITETAVSQAQDILIENMNALISKGFRFALDDFGKGESNLMYIVEMPVDIIKLDMDMTKAYFSSDKAKVVLATVAEMARQLGLPIVAEGVETKEELDGILKAGITHIQGYYYSRPLPMAEFIEYLTKAGSQVSGESAEQAAGETPGAAAAKVLSLRGRHILLVEDNELNQEIARDILEEGGFIVDTADDGTFAVEKVSASKPGDIDLILMDIRMPIMDGYEATRRIRELSDPQLAQIPIIALTAMDNEESRKAAFDADMNEHLVKPLDISKLNAVIKIAG